MKHTCTYIVYDLKRYYFAYITELCCGTMCNPGVQLIAPYTFLSGTGESQKGVNYVIKGNPQTLIAKYRGKQKIREVDRGKSKWKRTKNKNVVIMTGMGSSIPTLIAYYYRGKQKIRKVDRGKSKWKQTKKLKHCNHDRYGLFNLAESVMSL